VKSSLKAAVTIVIGLALGVGVGLLIPQDGIRSAIQSGVDRLAGADSGDSKAADQETEQFDNLVVISKTASQNLGLLTTRIDLGRYQSFRSVPAIVRERPAVSELQISSPYQGTVTRVFAVPGQAVRLNEPLFELRLTGEELARAQSGLLEAIQQIENVDAKIARIADLASRGGSLKREKAMLELDKKAFVAQRHNREQQLLIQGFSEEQVQQIKTTRQLIRTSTIVVPSTEAEDTLPDPTDASGAISKPDEWAYTIEDLHIAPGATVKRGDDLCDIAWHASLYIEGQAFEDDVELIREQMLARKTVPVELGADDNPVRIDERPILYINNRVGDDQLFRFYLPLENEILGDTFDARQRRFRSWRFKPGQRGHVLLPDQVFEDCFVLPPEAVTEDGNDAIVFRREHSHGTDTEYEAIKVHVLYRDTRATVVAADGDLKRRDRIVENRAYQLLLAMKSSAGGGHSHHGHDH